MPTSCTSQPFPRHPSWSVKIRPRSIGKLRCLYSGQRISTTYSQTILLVRELGQRSKRRCSNWWHIMRYVTCHVSDLPWRNPRAALARANPRTQRSPRPRCPPTLLPPSASAKQTETAPERLKSTRRVPFLASIPTEKVFRRKCITPSDGTYQQIPFTNMRACSWRYRHILFF